MERFPAVKQNGAITFRFRCEAPEQAIAYWKAMIEASRPTTCVEVHDVAMQLRDDDKPLEEVEL